MPRTWTPEQRAAAAERIRASKPWEKSTGPRTTAGKKRSSRNAVKHGNRTAIMRDAHKALTLQSEFLRLISAAMKYDNFDDAIRQVQTNYINNQSETII